MVTGVAELLAGARKRLDRVGPHLAFLAQRDGAVLVDIRPEAQRAEHGRIPDSLVVERNVLEWRFDPRSEARLPIAHYDLRVIVVCQEGYTSSLAAAALQDIGLYRATDLAGGYAAWRAAGLPVEGGAGDEPGHRVELYPRARRLSVDGRTVHLSYMEFNLLMYLVRHPHRVWRREELLDAVWGGRNSGVRTVDVHVRRIRVKAGDLVTTVPTIGYRLAHDAGITVVRPR